MSAPVLLAADQPVILLEVVNVLPALVNLVNQAPAKFAGSNPSVTTPSINPDTCLYLSVPGSAKFIAITRPGLITCPLYVFFSTASLSSTVIGAPNCCCITFSISFNCAGS